MSILDETARDWVKRLCTAHTEYCNKLDLLAVEYSRMSEANRTAVNTAVGGEGFVAVLAALPPAILHKCGLADTKCSNIALNVGGPLSPHTIHQILLQFPVEAAIDLMGMLGSKVYELAPSRNRALVFSSGEMILAVHRREAVAGALNNHMEEAILNAAKKGQC